MATEHQVTCINKSDRSDPHESIISIGGINPDGQQWKLSQQDAIRGIENGTWTFYVQQNGHKVNVIVTTHSGHKYLKTESDSTTSNNLLSLPEC